MAFCSLERAHFLVRSRELNHIRPAPQRPEHNMRREADMARAFGRLQDLENEKTLDWIGA
jgi:hypothetical protein